MSIEGSLQDMSLPTLVQSIIQEGRQVRVELKANNQIGYLYIEQGRLWDASVVDTSNHNLELFSAEEAVYELLKWKEGQFILERGINPSRQTIHNSWDHVLMEGLRKVDEQHKVEPIHPEETLGEMLLDLNEEDAAALRALSTQYVEKENEGSMTSKVEELNNVLEEVINNFSELVGIVITSNDGILLADKWRQQLNGNQVAALSTGLMNFIDKAMMQFVKAKTSQVLIQTQKGNVIFVRINDRTVFIALTPANVSLGLTIAKSNQVVSVLQEVLH